MQKSMWLTYRPRGALGLLTLLLEGDFELEVSFVWGAAMYREGI